MTRITVADDGATLRLTARGHAAYEGPSPQTGDRDLELAATRVCAGISAILYTLAGWLQNSVPAARLRLEPGDAELSCPGQDAAVRAVFAAAVLGLRQIEKANPAFVSVTDTAP